MLFSCTQSKHLHAISIVWANYSDEYGINCDQINFNIFLFSFIPSFANIFFSNSQTIWRNYLIRLIAISFYYYNFSIFTYSKLFSWDLSFSCFCHSKWWVIETVLVHVYIFISQILQGIIIWKIIIEK